MDRGIAYIRYTDGLSYYRSNEANSSAVYTATLWNGYLLIGTNQGVFYTPEEKANDFEIFSSLKFIEGTQGQVWSLQLINGHLYCGHNNGLLEICPDFSIRQLYRLNTGVFRIVEATINGKKIQIIVTYNELRIVNKETGKVNVMRQITDPIYDAEIDHLGNIWLETVSKGIYKCRLNEDMTLSATIPITGMKKTVRSLYICRSSKRADVSFSWEVATTSILTTKIVIRCNPTSF